MIRRLGSSQPSLNKPSPSLPLYTTLHHLVPTGETVARPCKTMPMKNLPLNHSSHLHLRGLSILSPRAGSANFHSDLDTMCLAQCLGRPNSF